MALGSGWGSPVGPVDGGSPVGPVDGGSPVGPVDDGSPVGPVDDGSPVGPVDGVDGTGVCCVGAVGAGVKGLTGGPQPTMPNRKAGTNEMNTWR